MPRAARPPPVALLRHPRFDALSLNTRPSCQPADLAQATAASVESQAPVPARPSPCDSPARRSAGGSPDTGVVYCSPLAVPSTSIDAPAGAAAGAAAAGGATDASGHAALSLPPPPPNSTRPRPEHLVFVNGVTLNCCDRLRAQIHDLSVDSLAGQDYLSKTSKKEKHSCFALVTAPGLPCTVRAERQQGFRTVSLERFNEEIAARKESCKAWELDYEMMTFCVYKANHHGMAVQAVATVEQFRGLGLGRETMLHCRFILGQQKLGRRISLWALSASVGFYHHLGFRECDFIPDKEDVVDAVEGQVFMELCGKRHRKRKH